ncbi:hypothetical protein SMICM17S_03524 [Streptomyces microflavus]
MAHQVDQSFLALPSRALADAALARARALGATHADFRLERVRSASWRLRDARPAGASDSTDLGYAVRVVHGGAWGFASGVDLTMDAAAKVASQAVAMAKLSAKVIAAAGSDERVELADEPVHGERTWVSAYDVDPFSVPDEEKAALLAEWSGRLLGAEGVAHVDASRMTVHENKFYADTAGTVTTQQRVRIQPEFTAVAVDSTTGEFDSMRTIAPPAGRGWEYLTGTGWDWDAELEQIPGLLAEKMRAPSVEAGTYDLVVDPSNLWLTIHEPIGHATELDRALGYEAAYAGTSFATFDQLGKLANGSPVMNVTGDRTAEHGLATVGYDDEGVEAQSWDLVKDDPGDYQLDRRIAKLTGWAGPTGARSRTRRAMSPYSAWRTCRSSRTRRAVDGGSDRRRRARDLCRRRPSCRSTCSATTSSSPGSGSSGSRTGSSPGSSVMWRTRRRPRTSGARWRRSAARRRMCSAARSTAARPSRARSRRSRTAAPPPSFEA